MAPRTQGMVQRGARGKGRGMEIDVLVDLERALASVARDHQTKAVRALGFGKRPLLIRRRQGLFFRKNPDLQKVDELRRRPCRAAPGALALRTEIMPPSFPDRFPRREFV